MERIEADVAIVGAGAAGCVLASRLSEEAGRRVVLVEAGGEVDDPDMRDPLAWPRLENKPYDYAYRTLPQRFTAGRVHPWPRGRGLGGSTLVHAMAHVWGHPADFDHWSAVAREDWSFAALRPFFERVDRRYAAAKARAEGSAAPLAPDPRRLHPLAADAVAAAEALGLPRLASHNTGRLVGATANTLLIGGGRRITVADAYLPTDGRANLTILTGASVETIVLAEAGTDGALAATGLRVRGSGRPCLVEAPTIVVAAGAIDSPLLLMRSGIGAGEVLAEAGLAPRLLRAGVGDNLADHYFGAGNIYRTRRPVAPSRLQHSEALLYAKRTAPWGDEGAPDVVAATVVVPAPAPGLAAPPPGEAFTLLFGITHPRSRGRLRPGGPHLEDAPVIDPNYLGDPADRAGMRDALAYARTLAATPPLADWVAEEVLPGPAVTRADDVDDFVGRALITHHHPAGTCAMGREGVVDADLRVKGTTNLFVCDASVFPSLPSGPIHATVSAVAEALAARITVPR
ncbi:GMC family oxidoreductase [Acuticoccus mangrovi]|uniref:GMC family oxidoreductase n=1 Tax=Acuticoccus mangrovi TaxID=2796142 RepID=A0A934IE44_9HYPH|nr:GMC family oxidoreductase [Acuticoccus mangrovi]MBJ3774904.1 GMC family oxidoreductase [Acuticoccus mangrovi]